MKDTFMHMQARRVCLKIQQLMFAAEDKSRQLDFIFNSATDALCHPGQVPSPLSARFSVPTALAHTWKSSVTILVGGRVSIRNAQSIIGWFSAGISPSPISKAFERVIRRSRSNSECNPLRRFSLPSPCHQEMNEEDNMDVQRQGERMRSLLERRPIQEVNLKYACMHF